MQGFFDKLILFVRIPWQADFICKHTLKFNLKFSASGFYLQGFLTSGFYLQRFLKNVFCRDFQQADYANNFTSSGSTSAPSSTWVSGYFLLDIMKVVAVVNPNYFAPG